MTRQNPQLRFALALSVATFLAGPAQAALVESAPVLEVKVITATPDPAAAWLAATAPSDGDRRVDALAVGSLDVPENLSDTALAVGSRTVPIAGTLTLWTFITTMRAQQQGDRFVALETNISLLSLAEGPAAPVPLPGAAWLLVMGLLGLAGVRVTGPVGGGRKVAGAGLPLGHSLGAARA